MRNDMNVQHFLSNHTPLLLSLSFLLLLNQNFMIYLTAVCQMIGQLRKTNKRGVSPFRSHNGLRGGIRLFCLLILWKKELSYFRKSGSGIFFIFSEDSFLLHFSSQSGNLFICVLPLQDCCYLIQDIQLFYCCLFLNTQVCIFVIVSVINQSGSFLYVSQCF